jgi:hypothetical protein
MCGKSSNFPYGLISTFFPTSISFKILYGVGISSLIFLPIALDFLDILPFDFDLIIFGSLT